MNTPTSPTTSTKPLESSMIGPGMTFEAVPAKNIKRGDFIHAAHVTADTPAGIYTDGSIWAVVKCSDGLTPGRMWEVINIDVEDFSGTAATIACPPGMFVLRLKKGTP